MVRHGGKGGRRVLPGPKAEFFKRAQLLSAGPGPNERFLCKVEVFVDFYRAEGYLAGLLLTVNGQAGLEALLSLLPHSLLLMPSPKRGNSKQLSFQLSLRINPAVVRQWKPMPTATPLSPTSFQKGGRPARRRRSG